MKTSAGDVDPLAAGGEQQATRARAEDGRRPLDAAKLGERVEFFEPPIVRNSAGHWARAPSTIGEVAFHIGGSPFVRFEIPGKGRTRACWVGQSTAIRA